MIIECKSLSSNWEKVSAYLGLSFELIETIKRDNPRDSAGCWNEALKEWIKQNYDTKLFGQPSWRSLLKAVAEVDKHQFQKLAAEHQGEKTKNFFVIIILSITAGGILIQVLVINIRIVRSVQKLLPVKLKLAPVTLEVRCYRTELYIISFNFIIHV